MKNIFVLVFCLINTLAFSQEYFKVELEARSPGTKDIVQQYEGQPAIPFLAKDVNGIEHSNFDYRDEGKAIILFFWNKSCKTCTGMMPFLDKMQANHQAKLQIISFADEPKVEILEFLKTQSVSIPVIANSEMLAEGPFGGNLGYPRMFFIDSFGVNKWVLPTSSFDDQIKAEKFVEALINQLVQ